MALAKLTAMLGPFGTVKFIYKFQSPGRSLRPLLFSLVMRAAMTLALTLTATTAEAGAPVCHSTHAQAPTSVQIPSRIDALIETEIRLGRHDHQSQTQFEQALAYFDSEKERLSRTMPDFDRIYRERYQTLAPEIENKLGKGRKLSQLEKDRRQRIAKEQMIRNVIDGKRAIFHEVQPGDFTRNEGQNQVLVTVTTMPLVMATHLTQIIYKTVAELANHRFPEKYKIDADPSLYKGDTRPVEQVSWLDAQTWADALNDLSDAGEPTLQALIPGHQKGMHYSPFMTQAQREYLMKIAKTEDGDSIDEMVQRNDVAKLKQYFAFDRSDSEGTVAVDQLKPLYIDGKPFYGLAGNVSEWTRDFWDGNSKLPGGTDPIGTTGSGRVVAGNSWGCDVPALRMAARASFVPGGHFSWTGIRLARTVP
jgi:formylglycine-generating enzyme required for sulfatase activity